MIGANFKNTALIVLVGAGVSSFVPPSAVAGGDIGGNCCADLEERVSELEAKTVGKGSGSVTLSISGQVNKAVLYIDNGGDHDTFVVDNGNEESLVNFTGYARIRKHVTAGVMIEFDYDSAESYAVSLTDNSGNDGDDGLGTDNNIDIRYAFWWLSHEKWGSLSIGLRDPATYLVTWYDLSGTLVVANTSKLAVGGSIAFRTTAGVQSGTQFIGRVAADYWEGHSDVVRYDSPEMRGFRIAASWGEDDMHDVALSYNGKRRKYQVTGAIGYSSSTDEASDYEQFAGSASILHTSTGLNLSVAGGSRNTAGSSLDQTYWYVKAGLKRKYRSLGETAISFDYLEQDEHFEATGKFRQWGAQVVQLIDVAATELYAAYSNSSYETLTQDFRDINMVMTGARMRF